MGTPNSMRISMAYNASFLSGGLSLTAFPICPSHLHTLVQQRFYIEALATEPL